MAVHDEVVADLGREIGDLQGLGDVAQSAEQEVERSETLLPVDDEVLRRLAGFVPHRHADQRAHEVLARSVGLEQGTQVRPESLPILAPPGVGALEERDDELVG